jgi:hypothetical protein
MNRHYGCASILMTEQRVAPAHSLNDKPSFFEDADKFFAAKTR